MATHDVEARLRVTGADQWARSFQGAADSVDKLSGVSGKMKDVGNKMGDVGSKMTNAFTKPAIIATTAVGGLFAALGFKRLVGIDNARAKLEGMGYSVEEVGTITDTVTDAVSTGMTTMGEGIDIAAGAMAAGVENGADLERYIKLVGDAAIGSNRPVGEMAQIFNRVEGAGKLMTRELQMIEHGMPGFSQAVAEHLGVTTDELDKMVTAGEVSSEDFLDVVEDFAGGMAEAHAETFSGMVKNVLAYVGIIGEKMGEGLFNKAKKGFESLEEFLSSDEVLAWAERAGEAIADFATKVIDKVKEIKAWWDDLSPAVQNLIGKFLLFGGIALVVLGPIISFLAPIITALGVIVGWIGTIATALGGWTAIFTAIFSSVGAIVMAIIAAAILIVVYWDEIKDFFIRLWEDIKIAGLFIWEFLKEVWAETVEYFVMLWEGVVAVFAMIWEIIKTTGIAIWEGLQDAWQTAVQFFIDLWDGAVYAFETIWNLIKTTAVNIWNSLVDGVMAIVNGFIKGITNLWNNLKDGTTRIFNAIKDAAVKIWNGLKNAVMTVVNGFKTGVQNAWNAIKSATSSAFNAIKGIATSIWNATVGAVIGIVTGLVSGLQAAWDTAKNLTSAAFKAIVGFIKNPLEKINLLNIGKAIIRGLIKGIKSMGRWVKDAIDKLTGWIPNWIKKKLGIASPSKVTNKLGIQIGEGLAGGISGSAKMVEKATNKLADSAIFEPMDMDIGASVANINKQASRQFGNTFESNMNIEKQPAVINVHVGNKKIASEIVDDITNMQNRSSFRGRMVNG